MSTQPLRKCRLLLSIHEAIFTITARTMDPLDEIDYRAAEFGDFYDELPLWSARFGLKMLDRIPLRRGMTILDVGAGTGFLTIELAQRCGANSTVIAVDPWKSAIDRLKRKVDYLGLQNVRILEQDVTAIELPDASVDLVVSNLGLNNFDDPDASIRNCVRIMKPGAQLWLTTNLVGHMHEFYEVYRKVLAELGLSEQLTALEAHVRHRATIDSVTTLVKQAGLDLADTKTWSFNERFADGSALFRHFFIRLGFVSGWKSILPPDRVKSVFAALETRLNSLAEENGELSLTIPAACVQAVKPAP